MPDNAILYGDYREIQDKVEYSILQFQSTTLDIDALWENGFQSASFLSNFWGTFFSAHHKAVKTDIEYSVRYIANELIGNAIKYSHEPNLVVKIFLSAPDGEFHFITKNRVEHDHAIEYQRVIKEILSSDPEKLYIDQMEQHAVDSRLKSCIGFLTIMLDYGGNLAWKFEAEDNSDAMTTTTIVRLPVTKNRH